jgi:hypothetical protein
MLRVRSAHVYARPDVRSRGTPLAFAVGAVIATIRPAPARADTSVEPPRGESRTLAGLAVVPPARFESPLPTTSIGLRLEGKLGGDDRGASKPPEGTSWRIASIAQSFDFSARVHPRIAVLGSIGVGAAAGAGDESFYELGAEGAIRYRLGLTGVVARLRGGATQVAAHLVVDGSRSSTLGAPAKIVDRFVEKQVLPDVLVAGRSSESVRASWSAAHVFGRRFAAQGSVGFATTFARFTDRKIERLERSGLVTMGAAIAAQVGPLAAQLELDGSVRIHHVSSIPTTPLALLTEDASLLALLGLYYAARRELVLGAGGGFEVAEGGRTRGAVRLEMRYVF